MYIDWTYIILVLPAVIFSLWASSKVNRTFETYRSRRNSRGITGAEAARAVLDSNGLYDVRVERVAGSLSDHYDPKENVIRLSDSVYADTSAAAVGVACHEAGHAVQHAANYLPVKIRTAIVPVTGIGSKLSMPLVVAGIVLSYLSPSFAVISYIGVGCFMLCTFFQLITLPTEYDASRRAIAGIRTGNLLTEDETKDAKEVLNAAALTYVAALAVSVMQLIRLLLMFRRRDD